LPTQATARSALGHVETPTGLAAQLVPACCRSNGCGLPADVHPDGDVPTEPQREELLNGTRSFRASATRPGWRPAGRRLAGPRLAQRRASGHGPKAYPFIVGPRNPNGRVFTTSSWSSCKSSTTVRSGPDRLRRRCRERDRRRRVLLAAYRDAGYVTVDLSDPAASTTSATRLLMGRIR